jgi:uncharacterized repeat protein (TIGR01451 family)
VSIALAGTNLVATLLVAFAFGALLMPAAASAETTLFDAPSAIDISAMPSPTIQSDKADYPPSASVTLTGADWPVNDLVKISVNDDEGQSWSLTDYVSPDASGNITYSFKLPDWFVARYTVVATGSPSGLTATSSFTDGNFASLQGQSKGNTNWVAGNLSGWQELDPIPMRVLIDPASADVNNVTTVTVEYDHTKTKGASVYQGLDRPGGFAVAAGDGGKVQCLNCDNPARSEPTGTDTWSVSFQVKPLVAAKSAITFRTRLRAGAHYFTGSSLALGGTANPGGGLGQLQVMKPAPKSGSPDLEVTKTGPSAAAPGSTITYTLNYGNSSTATSSATGIQLTDTLPSGVTYTSGCVAPTCSVSADGRTLVWDLGDLEPGASGSVSFTATIAPDLPYGTVVTNNAEIDSAENDVAFTDNQGSASTEVRFNRAPSATSQSASTGEDTAKTITLSGADPDGNSLSYKVMSLPANGALFDGSSVFATHITSVGTNGYVLSSNQVTYLPDPNYNGADSFQFKASDGSLDSSATTVSLTVTPVNDAPSASATPTSPTLAEDGQATITLAGTDAETAAADLHFEITALPAHGTLSKDGTALALGDAFTGSPQDVVYRPDPNYNGADQFKFELTDRGDPDNCGTPSDSCAAARSDERTVALTVTPVNDAPTTNDGTQPNVAAPASPTLPGDGSGTVAPPASSAPRPAQPAIKSLPAKLVETVPIKQIARFPRRCASRRHFRIRLRAPHGDRLQSAKVFVNSRQVKVVRGRRLASPVDLRGLPKGRFEVKILVTTASGRHLVGTRRYRTCTPRLPGRRNKRPPKL